MELSIIVPVYRVKDYLAACVESLLRQEVTEAEVVLVDDGSPDECGAMCDAWAAQYPERIRVVHRENGGLSAARNSGIAASRGRYLTFVDSDDAVAVNTYEPLLALLRQDPTIDLLEYPVCRHCGTPQEQLWQEPEVDLTTPEALFRHWMTHRGYLHTYAWNKIYRRELFETLRYPEGRYYEDILTIVPLLRSVQHYLFAPVGGYLYYDRPGAISQTNDARKMRDLLEGAWDIQQEMRTFAARSSEDSASLLPYIEEHLSTIADAVIDLLDTGVSLRDATLAPLLSQIDSLRPTLWRLLHLPTSAKARGKGVTWALFGTRAHCLLYHSLHRLFRRH
jgi:uncharacterized protein YuzB (UPF0349 family)